MALSTVRPLVLRDFFAHGPASGRVALVVLARVDLGDPALGHVEAVVDVVLAGGEGVLSRDCEQANEGGGDEARV